MQRYATLKGYASIQQKNRIKACMSLQKYHHRRVNNQTPIIEHLYKNKGGTSKIRTPKVAYKQQTLLLKTDNFMA